MAQTDGKVTLSTKLDTSGLKNAGKSIKSAISDTKSAMAGLAKSVAAAFSVSAIVNFSKQSGEAATQTEANIQRIVDIFGSASQQISGFIDANARAIGMSKSAAAGFSAVYGNLFSTWADQQQNAQLTAKYLQMTAVVASKTGRTMEDTQERIRSGLLGNTEAVEDLGIFVNVKTIEMTEAFQKLANGRSWEQLSANEQQQVRTMAILEQATKKYGDEVADTSALARAKYKAAYEDFQSTWGEVVNVVLLPVLKVMTEIFNVAIVGVQNLFGLSKSTADATSQYADNIDQASNNQANLNKNLNQTNKELKKATAGFDEIQTLSSGAAGGSSESTSVSIDEFGIGQIGTAADGSNVVTEVETDLGAIMIAIGGALAAVGVILLFSGSIAWGIGFVIAGASVFGVGEASLSGDNVSQTTASTLAVIMGVVAGALVAIGVILIMVGSAGPGVGFIIAGAAILGVEIFSITKFSTDPIKDTLLMIEAIAGGAMLALGIMLLYFGVNKPLAIGLIVAGAAVLAIAIAQIVAGKVSGEVAAWIYGITAIVSTALLVIGIIMLCTGHITPLSIGLLVAGAAGLATTIAINWGAIKEALQGPIGEVVAVVSGALLVIGAILAFTGVNLVLGIALIAAGAVGLGTTTALNWSTIKEKLQGPIGEVVAVVSGALLVIGAILAFTGVNLVLGIALIAAGAVGLGTTTALNWSTIKEKLQGPIGEVVAVVSAALLVIGAILAFSGAGLVLGIALMAAGAVGLATTTALNWNSIVDAMQGPIGKIVAIVSGALLVLGIILLLTGVGIPLGLGLIIAGAAGLATAVAFNWDSIVNWVKTAWDKVKAFWRVYIAPVFTGQFWLNLAKKCANGLISGFESAVNGIIGLFESMINWIVGGLNKISIDVPDWVPGIGGSKFGFNIPEAKFGRLSIPRLAQGAVIPPNREFMAVLGDQKHGTNIEAPLDTIKQALAEVLALQEVGGETVVTVNFTGDLAQLARVLKPAIETETRRKGGSLASGGAY